MEFKSANPIKTGIVSLHSFGTPREIFGIPADSLKHKYSPSSKVSEAHEILVGIRSEALEIFKRNEKAEFNKFDKLHGSIMLPLMLNDKRMDGALEILEIPRARKEVLNLPWWIEETASERSFSTHGAVVDLELASSSSYQLQALGIGGILPTINSVTVAGMLLTADGKLMVGLRGGLNFPNTYYFSAGSLGLTPEVKSGEDSAYRFYLKKELVEYPIDASYVKSANLFCRCQIVASRNISYVFVVKTGLSSNDIMGMHNRQLALNAAGIMPFPHSGEHARFEGIDFNPGAIAAFAKSFYHGVVANDINRTEENRKALPQAIAPLLALANLLPLMETLAKDGEH